MAARELDPERKAGMKLKRKEFLRQIQARREKLTRLLEGAGNVNRLNAVLDVATQGHRHRVRVKITDADSKAAAERSPTSTSARPWRRSGRAACGAVDRPPGGFAEPARRLEATSREPLRLIEGAFSDPRAGTPVPAGGACRRSRFPSSFEH